MTLSSVWLHISMRPTANILRSRKHGFARLELGSHSSRVQPEGGLWAHLDPAQRGARRRESTTSVEACLIPAGSYLHLLGLKRCASHAAMNLGIKSAIPLYASSATCRPSNKHVNPSFE